ncbi:hypothetical protein ABZS93_00595 [Streptomyces sp900116325]|uniref:hypothetical protein n=1 Tax=Streptomyces sp. 900116325 TaxID=3154295 RepID=UPI0033BCF572
MADLAAVRPVPSPHTGRGNAGGRSGESRRDHDPLARFRLGVARSTTAGGQLGCGHPDADADGHLVYEDGDPYNMMLGYEVVDTSGKKLECGHQRPSDSGGI